MSTKDRIYINQDYRDFIQQLVDKKILAFDKIDNKDIFTFIASLGYDNPRPCQKRWGFCRTQYLSPMDDAIISMLKLRQATNDDEINEYVDFDVAIEEAENAAESGFSLLSQRVFDSEWDKEVFERVFAAELESLYIQNVKNDL